MTEPTFLYDGWEPLLRVVLVGTGMYVALIAFLRISGSRTLASMNAFDFIVTVAIGSAFGRALTAKTVALAEALTAFALLIVLQYVVADLQTRWPRFKRVVTNPPALLYFRGEFLHEAMRRQRVTKEELRTAVREAESGSMDQVEALVLETDGSVSVVEDLGDASALADLVEDRRADQAGDGS